MRSSKYNILTNIGNKEIIYNTVSNRFMEYTPDVKRYLSGEFEDDKITEYLRYNNFIVDDDEDETAKITNLFFERRFSTKVYRLILNTSMDCNLKCWYCYESHQKGALMSQEMVDMVLKHLEVKSNTMPFEWLEITLFGGEPLMNYAAVASLLIGIKKLSKKYEFKIRLGIVTNGTFINKRYVELLKPFQVNFQITIDGDKDSHNAIRKFKIGRRESYGLILNGLKMLNNTDADFYYTIRVNYDDKVIDNVETLIRDISFMNRKRTRVSLHKVWQCGAEISKEKLFGIVNMINRYRFRVDLYALFAKFHCCYADLYNQAVINYNGLVYKCTARNFDEKNSCGRLSPSGQIYWDTETVKTRLSLKLPEYCKKCVLLPGCNGICSQNLLENESMKCPFLKDVTTEDIVTLNIKQQLITRTYEKV